jgi:hypothetical protein
LLMTLHQSRWTLSYAPDWFTGSPTLKSAFFDPIAAKRSIFPRGTGGTM